MKKRTLLAAIISTLIAGCASKDYVVYSEAMLPTVENGETVKTVLTRPRIGDLARYDLIVIQQPTEERFTSLMRVIALPGERVRIRGTAVYVNDVLLDVERVTGVTYRPTDTALAVYGIEQDYTVPSGKIFVLGDNFSRAKDSRIYGPVPEELLLAKVRKKAEQVGMAA